MVPYCTKLYQDVINKFERRQVYALIYTRGGTADIDPRLELIGQRLTGMILTTIVIPKQRCTPVAVLAEWLNERMEWNGS